MDASLRRLSGLMVSGPGFDSTLLWCKRYWLESERHMLQVAPNGMTASFISPALPEAAQGELKW